MFLSKVRNFEIIFFLKKTSLEKVFGYVLFGKKCHSTREKCRLVNGEKMKGSKEINPWFFLSKIEKFEFVFWGAY